MVKLILIGATCDLLFHKRLLSNPRIEIVGCVVDYNSSAGCSPDLFKNFLAENKIQEICFEEISNYQSDLVLVTGYSKKIYERLLYLKKDTEDMVEPYLNYKRNYLLNAVTEHECLVRKEKQNLELSKIEKQLKQANISNVYVYCFNDLGQAVYERLYYSNYNVICMFDQNAKNIDQKDVKVVQFDPKYLEPNSAVIVASSFYQDEIIEFISKDCEAKNVKILSFNPIFS